MKYESLWFKRYHVGKKLGAGAFGETYIAEDVENYTQVALKKIVIATRSHKTKVTEAMIEAEFNVLHEASLVHSNLIAYIDVFRDATHAFLVMEIAAGYPLTYYLDASRRVTDDQLWDIGKQLLGVLAFLETKGVAHRDIKPDNVMLAANADGTFGLKLIDYGFICFTDGRIQNAAASCIRMATVGGVVGTRAFLPPELLGPLDKKDMVAYKAALDSVDWFKADAYAAGVTLYRLAGNTPNGVGSPEARAAIAALMETDPTKRLTAREVMDTVIAATNDVDGDIDLMALADAAFAGVGEEDVGQPPMPPSAKRSKLLSSNHISGLSDLSRLGHEMSAI